MKFYYKSEVARAAGVSTRTLIRYINRNLDQLLPLGYCPGDKFIHPKALQWICDEYCIEM